MEKIIKFGEYEVHVKDTFADLMDYKANFGSDGLVDLMALKSVSLDNLQGADIDIFYRFFWIYAKNVNPDIPPLFDWLRGFEGPAMGYLLEVLPPLMEMMMDSIRTTEEPKN